MFRSIAELLSNVRVAYIGRKSECVVRRNKFVDLILNKLLNHGYITSFKFDSNRKVRITLKYHSGSSVFKSMVLVSTVRRQIFINRRELLHYKFNQFMLLSTKAGIITRDEALVRGLGGIMLFIVY
jgi:ribosomal protein S8